MGLGGPRWCGSSWPRGIAESGGSRLLTLMTDIPGDLVWDLPCLQQASYLEGGPLMQMLPVYLHVNKKSDVTWWNSGLGSPTHQMAFPHPLAGEQGQYVADVLSTQLCLLTVHTNRLSDLLRCCEPFTDVIYIFISTTQNLRFMQYLH